MTTCHPELSIFTQFIDFLSRYTYLQLKFLIKSRILQTCNHVALCTRSRDTVRAVSIKFYIYLNSPYVTARLQPILMAGIIRPCEPLVLSISFFFNRFTLPSATFPFCPFNFSRSLVASLFSPFLLRHFDKTAAR